VNSLREIQKNFGIPLTVHLVCDEPLRADSILGLFLLEQGKLAQIEVVFHGLSHACPSDVGRFSAWYHKHQAEYLLDSEVLKNATQFRFQELQQILGNTLGICPPCWLASKDNHHLFESLEPTYIESMLHFRVKNSFSVSPIISLGSPKSSELFWLRGLGHIMGLFSILLPKSRTRVALHVCDIQTPSSMRFFQKKVRRLKRYSVQPVLQRDLVV